MFSLNLGASMTSNRLRTQCTSGETRVLRITFVSQCIHLILSKKAMDQADAGNSNGNDKSIYNQQKNKSKLDKQKKKKGN